VRVWEEVLDTRPVGIRDDFFALGGDSMAAIEMLAAIERHTGVRLPPYEVGETSTIEGLAQAVERYKQRRIIGTLIEYRSQGTGLPLIFFDPIEVSSVVSSAAVLRHLDPVYPAYLAESTLTSARRVTYSMDDLVKSHVAAIRQVQPRGPYRLVGLCSGGYVALAVADALRAESEEVDFLALIHTGYPQAFLGPRLRRVVRLLVGAIRLRVLTPRRAGELYLTFRTLSLLAVGLKQRAGGASGLPLYFLRREGRVDISDRCRRFPTERKRVRIRYMGLRDWCCSSYVLPYWSGRLVLVAAQDPGEDPRDRTDGWERTADQLEVCHVPWRYTTHHLYLAEVGKLLNEYVLEADRVRNAGQVVDLGA
jgi:acyl carrier protein